MICEVGRAKYELSFVKMMVHDLMKCFLIQRHEYLAVNCFFALDNSIKFLRYRYKQLRTSNLVREICACFCKQKQMVLTEQNVSSICKYSLNNLKIQAK